MTEGIVDDIIANLSIITVLCTSFKSTLHEDKFDHLFPPRQFSHNVWLIPFGILGMHFSLLAICRYIPYKNNVYRVVF
jgi:hypothetical protein